ncbi:MAG: RNA polymerase sigma factor SigZ [Verrucomicrobiota bacterium]|nr:RNA polymerase sigma factor SigZ [Verrucomicrobiota bacterium]
MSPTPKLTTASAHQFDELWKGFAQPIRTYLLTRCSNAADADDLLQEVFIRIHRQLHGLKDTAKMQGWVYRIAHNVLIDYYRKRKIAQPLSDQFESEDIEGRDVVDLTPTLKRFVSLLPEPYRIPLVLHEFQGQPLKDVADTLGLTLTATKSRVQRARTQLRTMLDDCCRFEFDRRGKIIEAIPHEKDCRC